jgi:hypothetical protein
VGPLALEGERQVQREEKLELEEEPQEQWEGQWGEKQEVRPGSLAEGPPGVASSEQQLG